MNLLNGREKVACVLIPTQRAIYVTEKVENKRGRVHQLVVQFQRALKAQYR